MTVKEEFHRDVAQYIKWVCISTDDDNQLAPLSSYEKMLVDDWKRRTADRLSKKHGVPVDEIMS